MEEEKAALIHLNFSNEFSLGISNQEQEQHYLNHEATSTSASFLLLNLIH